jgi:ABC-type dipeptide/oligopeptide/nickel transport system permease subunit
MKLINFFQNFKQPDKRKHFVAGFAISLLIGVFVPWLGLVLAFIAGAIKEWWDSKGNGTPEWLDFIFTCIGAICAFPVALIIHALIW